jgi:hypothetical protein
MFNAKAPLERPFVVVSSTPTAVKVAEIVPWIHHSRVKPASLEWECIPDPALPYNSRTLSPRDPASQETVTTPDCTLGA